MDINSSSGMSLSNSPIMIIIFIYSNFKFEFYIYCIIMSQKNTKKCNICQGEYPINKHNFEECYSLDFDWDVAQIKQIKLVRQCTNNKITKEKKIKSNKLN
jgi:hypothetical protein